MAFIMTRINVGDFDAWKPSFDKDIPRAREAATGYRLFRALSDPDEVFVQVEFASADDAQVSRDRLLSSGVLDRFTDKSGPIVVEEVDTGRR
jgi:hypothetical protein